KVLPIYQLDTGRQVRGSAKLKRLAAEQFFRQPRQSRKNKNLTRKDLCHPIVNQGSYGERVVSLPAFVRRADDC
ncbi:hypothetical protein, partial [Mesorhizobium sp.]|uniref:hypothetical protein n=1 Tax=Mesorhizobium sp. TaxID=1871066 RepID=UPI0025804455